MLQKCVSYPPIQFNLYREWLVKEALVGTRDFKIGVIETIKYADGLVLLVQEEESLQVYLTSGENRKKLWNGKQCRQD